MGDRVYRNIKIGRNRFVSSLTLSTRRGFKSATRINGWFGVNSKFCKPVKIEE
jgi:hypothetical protein